MNGYCWTHDREYPLIQGDEVCPRCLANKEQDLEWREQDYAEELAEDQWVEE